MVFATGGARIRIFDERAEARENALSRIAQTLGDMHQAGLAADPQEILPLISVCDTLAAAVTGADYVQESVFERVDVKTAVCAEIGKLIAAPTVLGSSSSGIPASRFTEGIANRDRFLVAHPVNPPHLNPTSQPVWPPR